MTSFPSRLLLLASCAFAPLAAFGQSPPNYSVGTVQLCSLEDDGQVSCLVSSGSERLLPPADLPPLVAVTAGDAHACGITFEGEAVCWGGNDYGQLTVPALDLPLTQINAGNNHTCAVDMAGEAICWGLNSNRQLEPPEGATFVQVDAGGNNSCGILVNEDITCWSTETSGAPELVTGPFVDLDILRAGVCGLTRDGDIRCSDGVVNDVPDNGPYTQFAATRFAICGLDVNGALDCAVSDLPTTEVDYPQGLQLSTLQAVETGVTQFTNSSTQGTAARTGSTMCGELPDGSLTCWAQDTNFPDLDGASSVTDSINTQRLDLDARVYSSTAVEIFYTPIGTSAGSPRSVEIYRNGELVDTITSSFSYYDRNALTDNTYQIRLVDDAGNVGPLSDPLSVDTSTGVVLFNGVPPRTASTQDNFLAVFTDITFQPVGVSLEGFIVSWEIDPAEASSVTGYEVRVGSEAVGFTPFQLFVAPETPLNGSCVQIFAVGNDGSTLDSITTGRGSCS